MEIGYWLASEEHGPKDLVAHARLAEEAGFSYVLVSDHIHPWVDAQGHSPFVWGVIGAIAQATGRIRLGTAVTIYGKVTGVYAPSEATARKIGLERQPNAAMGGAISQELPLPRDFQAVAELVREDDLEGALVLGADPASWREHVEQYRAAGFTHVCLHDVAQDQRAFIEFAAETFLA